MPQGNDDIKVIKIKTSYLFIKFNIQKWLASNLLFYFDIANIIFFKLIFSFL